MPSRAMYLKGKYSRKARDTTPETSSEDQFITAHGYAAASYSIAKTVQPPYQSDCDASGIYKESLTL